MLTAQVESYSRCLPELRELYPLHWRELALNKDVIPLDPNYEAYAKLDEEGVLLLVTLRDEAWRLVGYFLGFIFPELHYKTTISCFGDFFYVSPEHRTGWAGVKLFRAVEVKLRQIKTALPKGTVMRWFVQSKLHLDCGALLRRCGFTAIETHYCKLVA